MSLPDTQYRRAGKDSSIERISTVGQTSDLGNLEKNILRLRQEQLVQLLEHIHTLHINSSKEAKTLAFIQIIFDLTGRRMKIGEEVRMYEDGEREPILTHAIDIAAVKAVRALRGNQGAGIAAYGADVNAHIENGEVGVMKQQHKLERLGEELKDHELIDLYHKMKQQYCHPRGMRVRIIWDIASQFINGKTLSSSDKIEIISNPIDPHIFDQFFFDAVKNGLLLSSNLHFGAIECLVAHGKIKSIAILSRELEDAGYSFEKVRQTDTGLFVVAMNSILDNTPPHIH